MTIVNGPGRINQYTYNAVSKTHIGQASGTDFSNVLNGTLRDQAMQSAMMGMSGLGGMDMIPGTNMMSGMAIMEDSLLSVAETGEMSGVQLMMFMMIMMMQTSDNGGDLAPIIQMVAQMLSEPSTQSDGISAMGLQNDMLRLGEMETGARRMVDAALSQVGYHERNRDGSIGSGNFTQFGAWYGMDGQPWCAMFVSWAADRAGILNDVVPRHASTNMGVAAYQAKGQYSPRSSGYIPREGDAIYFQNPSTGRIHHVGIVVAFDPLSQRVYTVEGNTSNAVRIRHYDLNSPRIHGYGRNGGTSFGTIPGNSTSGSGANTI